MAYGALKHVDSMREEGTGTGWVCGINRFIKGTVTVPVAQSDNVIPTRTQSSDDAHFHLANLFGLVDFSLSSHSSCFCIKEYGKRYTWSETKEKDFNRGYILV